MTMVGKRAWPSSALDCGTYASTASRQPSRIVTYCELGVGIACVAGRLARYAEGVTRQAWPRSSRSDTSAPERSSVRRKLGGDPAVEMLDPPVVVLVDLPLALVEVCAGLVGD